MKANYLVTSVTDWDDTTADAYANYASAVAAAKDCVERGHTDVVIWERRANAVPTTNIEIIREGD